MAGFRPKSSGQQESNLEVNGNYIHQMSKKISDLTQVVHMLFVQNHEKDVLIEALKRGYDKEFCRVIETGKERIRQIGEEYQQKHSVENGHGREQDLAAAALQISQQEDKIISISNELREVKLEKEKLEEKVKALSDATLKSDAALDNARSEVEHWKKFSSNVQEKCKETENTLSETLRSIPNIKRECFEEMEKKFVAIIRDNLKTSNRLYRLVDEQKEKLLKLEEEKKSSVPSNDGENDVVGSDDESTEYKSYDPKLDQLIRENKWLRMELSNREGNFNKIFTRFQPVVVKTGAAKSQAAISDRTRRHDRRRHRTPAPTAPETLPADDAELDGVAAHQFRSLRLPPVSKKDATISSHALRRAPTSPHFNGKHVTGSMNLLYQNR